MKKKAAAAKKASAPKTVVPKYRKDLTAGDVRFTSKIGALYAFRDALAGARSRHPDAGSRRQIGGRQNSQPETAGTTAANSNSPWTSSPCA